MIVIASRSLDEQNDVILTVFEWILQFCEESKGHVIDNGVHELHRRKNLPQVFLRRLQYIKSSLEIFDSQETCILSNASGRAVQIDGCDHP